MNLEFPARQAIENCMQLKEEDRLCIITDIETRTIAEALKKAAEKVTEDITLFIMEDYGKRDPTGKDPITFPEEIRKVLERSTASIYAASSKKNELKTFRKPMINIVERNNIRHAHMPNIDERIMLSGMSSDYNKIKDISKKVYDLVSKASKIRVMTEKGTDFTVELGYRWIISDGDLSRKNWTNLPDGEVFTCVKNINGKAIIDGVLGDYFQKFGIIDKTPLELEFRDGNVTSIQTENDDILEELKTYIEQDENASRIGEFAIGTNIGLKKLIGNLLQDEKFPSVHIAIGHGYPEKTGVEWNSDAHLDCVIPETSIIVDGKKLMDRGKFLL